MAATQNKLETDEAGKVKRKQIRRRCKYQKRSAPEARASAAARRRWSRTSTRALKNK